MLQALQVQTTGEFKQMGLGIRTLALLALAGLGLNSAMQEGASASAARVASSTVAVARELELPPSGGRPKSLNRRNLLQSTPGQVSIERKPWGFLPPPLGRRLAQFQPASPFWSHTIRSGAGKVGVPLGPLAHKPVMGPFSVLHPRTCRGLAPSM